MEGNEGGAHGLHVWEGTSYAQAGGARGQAVRCSLSLRVMLARKQTLGKEAAFGALRLRGVHIQ